jgi:S1-C subfamily serine protease
LATAVKALIGLLLLQAAGAAHAANLRQLRDGVFKILVTASEPDFGNPWRQQESSNSNGTGFYIGDGRILTNAHVVANATYIAVLRDGDSKPVPAHVKFIAHDADLALLELKDKAQLDNLRPMRFGGLPKLRSAVATIGFPTGGEQISVTEGIVSRISYRRYVHHGNASHLLVQVDSAINPGNSGGPVVQGRSVVGVAFQSFTRAENTGYIIPVPVIERFLKDVEDGRYDGHPQDGLGTMEWALLNPSTAAFHGLEEGEGGTKIAHVADWAPTAGKLQVGDIVLAIDGQKVGVDGKVDFQDERVDFRTIFDLKQHGEIAGFKIVRDGKRQSVDVPVTAAKPHHEPELLYAKHPRYFVWAGMVFSRLSRSFLRSWGERWYRDAPLILRFFDIYSSFEPETRGVGDLVVLLKRLPDAVNAYATENVHGIVREVDGEKIETLAELIERIETGTGEFVVIRFLGSNEPLVLSRRTGQERNGAIIAKYGVAPDRWLTGAELDGAIFAPTKAGEH